MIVPWTSRERGAPNFVMERTMEKDKGHMVGIGTFATEDIVM